jgi:hypothetical protein
LCEDSECSQATGRNGSIYWETSRCRSLFHHAPPDVEIYVRSQVAEVVFQATFGPIKDQSNGLKFDFGLAFMFPQECCPIDFQRGFAEQEL